MITTDKTRGGRPDYVRPDLLDDGGAHILFFLQKTRLVISFSSPIFILPPLVRFTLRHDWRCGTVSDLPCFFLPSYANRDDRTPLENLDQTM